MKVLITGRIPDRVVRSIRREHDAIVNEHDTPMPYNKILSLCSDRDGRLCTVVDTIEDRTMDMAPHLRVTVRARTAKDEHRAP